MPQAREELTALVEQYLGDLALTPEPGATTQQM